LSFKINIKAKIPSAVATVTSIGALKLWWGFPPGNDKERNVKEYTAVEL
jgi:hypothetical protein